MKKSPNKKDQSRGRRNFIKTVTASFTGLTILPSSVVSGLGHTAPSDKLNIAGVGVGGIGRRDLRKITGQNIVALCDVDWKYAKKCFDDYPDAKRYKDYRVMFDKQNDIEAVLVDTSDHTHAIIAMEAMRRGKHVFVQKPLAHSVYETRVLTETARKYQVATQMGNQGNSGEDIRKVCEWIWDGAIGDVHEVHAWTDRPIWPQGLERPEEKMEIPGTLNWDLFIGPAPYRPYHSIYTPWNWRGWWDFGTGALGDMGCHVLDPVYKALKLKFPVSVQASSTTVNTESPPIASKIQYIFPKRKGMKKINLPKVIVNWYDGGLKPNRPPELPKGVDLGTNGIIMVGTKGKLVAGLFGSNPFLLPKSLDESYTRPKPTLPRIKNAIDGHWMDWVRACKESPENRTPASSNFDYAGPLSESVVMGNLAIRLQDLDQTLAWDGENMKITNIDRDAKIRVQTTDKFKVVDGHPHFNKEYKTINAQEAANEYIKHPYRNGWSL